MPQTAHFYFHGSLSDFLRGPQREVWFGYTFSAHQTLKDMIEAIGVPHVEVRAVQVNGEEVPFGHRLQTGDRVEVYPYDGREEKLLPGIDRYSFVLDVHLGTLARSLRMLGFDTVYENTFTDKEIAGIAEAELRIVLTRDVNLLKQKAIPVGYWLRSQHTEAQLQEVIERFGLIDNLKPFTRCMVCNGLITEVPKGAVLDLLPPKTQLYFDEFYRCTSCQRVYWKGSHYERMQEFLLHIKQSNGIV